MDKVRKLLEKQFVLTILAVVLGLLVAGIILVASGYPPIDSLVSILDGMFSSPKNFFNVIIKSTPLIICGIGIAFAYKTGLFNIGAEGQFMFAAIISTIVGIVLDLPPVLMIPTVLITGIVAGAFWGSLVGFLKAKFGIHEVLSSIMLNWVALYLSNFLVTLEGFRKPQSQSTYVVSENSWTTILGVWKKTDEAKAILKSSDSNLVEAFFKTDLNIGIIVAIVLAIVVAWVLYKTTFGMELRAVGFNKHASKVAGINVKRNTILSMAISGGIVGLAASLYITGQSPHSVEIHSSFMNYGFNGLGVCLIAASSPVGCIFAGLLFGGLLQGGTTLQRNVGAPSEIINIVIGVIIFFMALTYYVPVLLDKFKKGKKDA